MKILVVDDDQDQRHLRSQLLIRHGFDTFEAPDRATATRLAIEHRPSAVVLDLGLPTTEDGLALIRELRSLDAAVHLIVLTGRNRRILETRPEAELIDHLMVKPASTAQLVRALRAYQ